MRRRAAPRRRSLAVRRRSPSSPAGARRAVDARRRRGAGARRSSSSPRRPVVAARRHVRRAARSSRACPPTAACAWSCTSGSGPRSELAQSMEGDGPAHRGLRTRSTAISALPRQPDGTRRLALSLDPATGGVPLQHRGRVPGGADRPGRGRRRRSRTLVTHLIVPPAAGDDAPSLGVAVVAEVGAPARAAARRHRRAAADRRGRHGRRRSPGWPPRPTCRPPSPRAPRRSTRCSPRPNPADAELVDALRTAVAGRTVLGPAVRRGQPRRRWPPAGLLGELDEQTASGRAVLDRRARRRAGRQRWPCRRPTSAPTGIAALAFSGAPRVVVVAATQVEPLDAGHHQLLARPARSCSRRPRGRPTDGPRGRDLQAFATDPVVLERLDDRRLAGPRGQPRAGRARAPAPRAAQRRPQRGPARSTPAHRRRCGAARARRARRRPPVRADDARRGLRPRRAAARRRRQPGGASARCRRPPETHHARPRRSAAPGRPRRPRDLRRPRRPRQPQRSSRSTATCSWPRPPTLNATRRQAHVDAVESDDRRRQRPGEHRRRPSP